MSLSELRSEFRYWWLDRTEFDPEAVRELDAFCSELAGKASFMRSLLGQPRLFVLEEGTRRSPLHGAPSLNGDDGQTNGGEVRSDEADSVVELGPGGAVVGSREEIDIRLAKLTPRQWDVIDLMKRGYRGPAIARRLCIAKSTVKTFRAQIYRILRVHNKDQALELLEELESR